MNESLQPENVVESTEYTFRRVLATAQRHWMIIASCLAIAVVVAAIRYAKTTPKFEASGAVMVQHSMPQSGFMETPLDREIQGYSDLFISDSVLSKAISKLSGVPAEIDTQMPEEYWPSALAKMLAIAPRRSSNIIDISCISEEPEACVDVISAVVDSAMEVFGETQKNHSLEYVNSLDKERKTIETTMLGTEEALLLAKRNCGDFGISQNAQALHPKIQRAIELSDALLEVQKSKLERETLLDQIQATARLGGDLLQHMQSFDEMVGEEFALSPFGITKNDISSLSKLQDELREKQRILEETNRFFGPAHPKHAAAMNEVHKSQARIDAINDRINGGIRDQDLGQRLVQILQASIQNLTKREQAIQSQYALAEKSALALNDEISAVATLERKVGMLRDRHEAILKRIADVDVNLDRSNIQFVVVSDPTLPTSPYSPKLQQTFGIAIMLGIMASVGLIWVIEVLNGKFIAVEQIETEVGQRVLSVIGKIPAGSATTGWDAVHCVTSPQSIEGEAFRTLRASIGFAGTETACISVTSSEPSDGKTTVVSNLASSFAQAGVRCLLIDADMRKPGMSKLLGKRGLPGLSDILRSDEDVHSVAPTRVHSSEVGNVEFIACGAKPSDPAALLSSSRMEDLLGWAVSSYDQVIIDCPPALIASDALIVGRLADSCLMVVNPDKNKRRAILRTADTLKNSGVEIAGLVLNNASMSIEKSYYGYGKGYGSHYQEEAPQDSASIANEPLAEEVQPTIPFKPKQAVENEVTASPLSTAKSNPTSPFRRVPLDEFNQSQKPKQESKDAA